MDGTRGAVVFDTPREKGSPLKTTEAELDPRMYPACPITLHDASMTAMWRAAVQKSMRVRVLLGSGLFDQSQKMTVAARAMADKKTVGHRS